MGLKPENLDALGNVDKITGGEPVDKVLVNPPFEKLSKPWEIDGYQVVKLDHRLAAEALGAMKDDGKAVLIVGATKESGGMQDQERPFFNWLYSTFNVVDHFEVAGDLYKRMGAQWPVRFIVIDGRQASEKIAPAPGTIDRLDSWKALYGRYERFEAFNQKHPETDGQDGAVDALDGGQPTEGAAGGVEGSGQADGQSSASGQGGKSSGRAGSKGKPGTGSGSSSAGRRGSGQSQSDVADGQLGNGRTAESGGLEQGKSDTSTGKSSHKGDQKTDAERLAATSELASDFQVPYTSTSSGFNEGILTPRNMGEALNESLTELKQTVGDLDLFVMNELGYDSKEALHKAFMGLQVDAVAAAIFNIKRGQAVIIADQTGVGKGRQAAAIQRYALRNNLIPVFFTETENLFTDMHEELHDIGEQGVKPFILNDNVGVTVPGAVAGTTETLFARTGTRRTHGMNLMQRAGKLPEEANAVWLRYTQVNRVGNIQQWALMSIADKAVMILDESHNAAGDSNTGAFMKALLAEAKGAVYLSATWAKRPDNVPVYSLTSLGRAVTDVKKLPEIMQRGGLPLQTIISNMLSREGQLFRRERSFKGIDFNTRIVGAGKPQEQARQEAISDAVTDILRSVVDANSVFLNLDFESIKAEIVAQHGGSASSASNNKASVSVNSASFTSVAHNE